MGGQRVPSPLPPVRPLTPFVAESPPAAAAPTGHPPPENSYDDRRPIRQQRTAAPPPDESSSSTDRGAAYPADFRVGQDVHFLLSVASFGLHAGVHSGRILVISHPGEGAHPPDATEPIARLARPPYKSVAVTVPMSCLRQISPAARNPHIHGPTVETVEVDFEDPADVERLRRRLIEMLAAGTTLPDFKVQHIPIPNQDPVTYRRLHELLLQRNRTEFSLNNMLDDKAADGTPLDPYRNFEDDYEILSQLHDDVNRAMFRIYINYLEPAAGTSLLVMSATDGDTEPPCPYRHARNAPLPPVTQPQFDPIEQEPGKHALSAHASRAVSIMGLSTIADTGASHILFREADASILTQVTRCTRDKPCATLKAANGALLRATGRGKLTIANIQVEAYIFQNEDFANNLLGMIPFSNLGCTAIFKPHWFGVYPPKNRTPIIVGTRTTSAGLWFVDLAQFASTDSCGVSDCIPPPSPAHPGAYIEANAIALHDNASYVKFVHASLGYPAPSTFLRAVTEGYITGPHQFSRLTPKMVRKFIPNAMPSYRQGPFRQNTICTPPQGLQCRECTPPPSHARDEGSNGARRCGTTQRQISR